MAKCATAMSAVMSLHSSLINKIIAAFSIGFVLNLNTAINFNMANAEYFSSVDSLQKLKDIELGFVKTFQDYLDMRDEELERYSNFIEHVKVQHRKAFEDIDDYLGNPINAFTLIKRMATDWHHLHESIKSTQSRIVLRQTLLEFNKTQQLPDDGELKGAAKSLARLQRVYNLSAHEMANGTMKGIDFGTSLSFHDCFEIAVNLYDEKDFDYALNWFELTLEKLADAPGAELDAMATKIEIETLEYLMLTNYEMGVVDEAVYYLDLLLELEPQHYTKNMLDYILSSKPKLRQSNEPKVWYQNYTRLCRGEQVPDQNIKNLLCSVETRGSPHFLLAPLKIEQLSKDPVINIYHEILNDKQIARIFADAAEKQPFRSLVRKIYGDPDSENIISDERVSQQTWLGPKKPSMKTIYNLLTDITDLDMYNAEFMQVANYGIGGQYEPHTDFFGPACFQTGRWLGDRITTNMFYLSNVEQGGYTVFPRINIYSRPVKGALIIWYNLHRSLDGDQRMQHAGCPVLKGSKKIGNVWVHAHHQELRRPCLLKSDTFKSEAYKAAA